MSRMNKDLLRSFLLLNEQGRVNKRESVAYEYKQAFEWTNKEAKANYIKSIAAFANNKGGYLVFGVTNTPRTICGIDDVFSNLDDAEVSSFLSKHFSIAIEFEREEITMDGLRVGFLYIHESLAKPVVCIKDYDRILQESTIYFRYNSRSEKIKSGDLLQLLNEAREQESKKWIALFSKVATVGVDKVGIYNADLGELTTSRNNKFILDENLIRRLKVIDKYSMEVAGSPAIRIVGEIDHAGTVVTKSKYLYDEDIMLDFLVGQVENEPSAYLVALCHQNSFKLPVYAYLRSAGMSLGQGITYIEQVNKSSNARTKLIERLRDDNFLFNARNNKSIHSETAVGTTRMLYYNRLMNHEEIGELESAGLVKRLMEAVLNLNAGEYNIAFVHNQLVPVVGMHYANKNLSSCIREGIAYLDLIENRGEIVNDLEINQ